jgi:NTP pyrophosphatase (non-canonical NTP hydrolase)
MNIDKLNQWAKEIHDNATAHGWHEEKHSPEHFLALVMCEVAEAIEADRKGKYYIATGPEPSSKDSKYYYQYWYETNVKGTVDEEFADIVIRLLDMAEEANCRILDFECHGFNEKNFTEQAWCFVTHLLGVSVFDISASISFMYSWAEHLGINLDQHIEWKMRCNKHRPYKHGGKKY